MESKKELSLTLLVFLSTFGSIAVMSPSSTSDTRQDMAVASSSRVSTVVKNPTGVSAAHSHILRPFLKSELEADIHPLHFAQATVQPDFTPLR